MITTLYYIHLADALIQSGIQVRRTLRGEAVWASVSGLKYTSTCKLGMKIAVVQKKDKYYYSLNCIPHKELSHLVFFFLNVRRIILLIFLRVLSVPSYVLTFRSSL